MTRSRIAVARFLPILLAGLLTAGAVHGAQERPQIIPVSEIKAGMTGYGLTCLESSRPQKFQVEVLGNLRGWTPKGDVILIRMSGPVIDDCGVISGMSGSPIYIEGKLAGAVAYGWRYCKIPLAGVTPAGEMMRVQEIQARAGQEQKKAAREVTRHALRNRSRELARLLTSGPRTEESNARLRQSVLRMAGPATLRAPQLSFGPHAVPPTVSSLLPGGVGQELRPLLIPMAINGLSSAGAPLLSLLDGTGFMPVQGAAIAARGAPEEEVILEPGVTVGAAFVCGDMDIAGMGTLTWIEGDNAVAFGHPMFGSGETDIPLAVGHVQTIVPSIYSSFKLASTGKLVGRITQDRSSGVLAKIGEKAPMFPCKVRVRGTVDDQYSYQVAGYWETAPLFTLYALADSSARWEGLGNRYFLKAKATISFSGQEEPLIQENVYNSYSVVPPSMDLVVIPMEELLLNPYREVEIEGIDYELEVQPGFQAALIESVWADRVMAEPGSEVTVYVRLLEFRGERLTKKLKLQVPETARPGSRVDILVCDALADRMIRRGMDPGSFAPPNFESLLDYLKETESNKSLILRASFVERGVRYDGDAMPSLPPSALSILQFKGSGGQTTPLVTDTRETVETPWVLEGAQSLSIIIKERDPYNP